MDHRERQDLIDELERQQEALLNEIAQLETIVENALSKVSAIQHGTKPHAIRRIDSAHTQADDKKRRAA
jgi:hypothetical protein